MKSISRDFCKIHKTVIFQTLPEDKWFQTLDCSHFPTHATVFCHPYWAIIVSGFYLLFFFLSQQPMLLLLTRTLKPQQQEYFSVQFVIEQFQSQSDSLGSCTELWHFSTTDNITLSLPAGAPQTFLGLKHITPNTSHWSEMSMKPWAMQTLSENLLARNNRIAYNISCWLLC